MKELIILVGLPGSGKDSIIKTMYKEYENISSDLIRVELYGFEDQTHNAEVFDEMKKRTILASQKSDCKVIYNATNLSRKRRVALATEMQKYYDSIKVVCCLCSVEELLIRNKERDERHLPEDKLKQMIKTIQLPNIHEFNYDKIIFFDTDGCQELEKYKLENLMDYNQNNKHHNETLGQHIARVINECRNDYLAQIAALYHDLGKPFCREEGTDGYSHYKNHNLVSAYYYAIDCLRTGRGLSLTDYDILLMIEFHDYIFNFDMDCVKMKEHYNKRYIGLSDDFWKSLEILIKADRLRP